MTDHAETLRQWDNEPEHKEALAALEQERDENVAEADRLAKLLSHETAKNARLQEALNRIADRLGVPAITTQETHKTVRITPSGEAVKLSEEEGENARLREALREIASASPARATTALLQRTARAALTTPDQLTKEQARVMRYDALMRGATPDQETRGQMCNRCGIRHYGNSPHPDQETSE